jgi:glucose/arabinose dehydrogenase
MTTVLVSALITTLGFGGLVALRYGWDRTRFGVVTALVIAIESLALGVLFVVLSWGRIGGQAWIEVPLRFLALQAVGLVIAAAVLGICFFVITTIFGAGRRPMAAATLGLLIPVGALILLVGIRINQTSSSGSPAPAPVLVATRAPGPAPTPIPASSYTRVERVFPSLSFREATNFEQPDDGKDLVFVTELLGRVHVFSSVQQPSQSNVFLDLTDRVDVEIKRGLMGLAFDPNYRSNGYFYLYYAAEHPTRAVLARYSVSQKDPRVADVSSEFIILELPPPPGGGNLYGGQIGFGPDGYLYLAVGDGGEDQSRYNNGQNTAILWGKVLRIDVSNLGPGERYRIPPDNPFVSDDSVRDEIWAIGFREPWRFSFDKETGRLWLGDVGWSTGEEVNLIEKGLNYGASIFEGSRCYALQFGCDATGLQFPVTEFGHDLGCAVIGGYVYRGRDIPSLEGGYVYGDHCTGQIWAIWYDGKSITKHQLLVDTDLSIGTFGRDRAGSLYVLTAPSPDLPSGIYRLVAAR